ncbi:MAG: undecaprenyldiphospho-muramoylpentapeptide beta-N-acetylglucosaminyltransferase [Crocinitomicaceae bacterium]|nr:undecaprenyldiphospho-muramoylpentapeptide beta-N-acetylglucosaminyltransferase [Crocinitomicaceae bacterium]
MKLERVIISGGGTGGHIFPAVAIADEIKKRNPEVDILFIGAKGKMEMEKVPAAGYKIEGLDIRGFQRKFTLSNFLLPFKIISSLWKARRIIKKFKPQFVIGVGGYASGPTLQMANLLKIPTLLQEQNSYPGKTNRILAKKAHAICVAYENLESVFEKKKIHFTGNPVRLSAIPTSKDQTEARRKMDLDLDKPTLLIIGGSLGARTLNQSVMAHLKTIEESEVQIVWQCGKFYLDKISEELENSKPQNLHFSAFIQDMATAYQASDVIISRAGALSVSELCLVGKPSILVPSPNVAEDHQTKNAMALVNNDAAILIKDHEAELMLIPTALELYRNKAKSASLSENILKMGKSQATQDIVDVIESIAQK